MSEAFNGAAVLPDDAYLCAHEAGMTEGRSGRIVVVFQGGGALGAYQAGVYEAIHESGVEPDWMIGTSIGAINASLIVGNAPEDRLPALREFWRRVESRTSWHGLAYWPQLSQSLNYLATVATGIPAFFEPNPLAFLGPHVQMSPEAAGYYTTAPLERTLSELVDFDRINAGPIRLTVGAAHVTSSRMRYFDSSRERITVKHILASGALPPAFPAVRIDGELYWDGGILSNTPTEVVFDEIPRRNSLIFAVHMWAPDGPEPRTLWEVAHRQKDIQYSSRIASHILRQQQAHRLRHVIGELIRRLPESELRTPEVRELAGYGCLTQSHVVRLLAPRLAHEDQTKDTDFTASGIQQRWRHGYSSSGAAILAAPWKRDHSWLEGVILHEPGPGGWFSYGADGTEAALNPSPMEMPEPA